MIHIKRLVYGIAFCAIISFFCTGLDLGIAAVTRMPMVLALSLLCLVLIAIAYVMGALLRGEV